MSKTIEAEELVRLYTQPGNGFTDAELGERFGVDRTAIYKWRRKLEDTGIEFEQTEYGRWRINREKFVSNIRVNQYEALVLYLATRRLSRNTRLAKRHVQNALEKLALALYKPMTKRLVKAAATVPDHPEAEKREAVLEELVRGWMEQYKVHIRYHGLKSEKATNHTICPYLIEPSPWSDSVYVVAKTNVWDEITPFQLERIEKASLSTEPFAVDARFEEEALFKYAWGIWYSDRTPKMVKLRFTGREAIRRLQESVWHPEQEINSLDDGSVIWSAPISESQEMLPWIRGWGADCEVLAPESLRWKLEREARRLAALYGVAVGDNNPEQFYAHSKPDLDESEWQLLIDHLRETAELAFELGEDAGVSELAKAAGTLHDIGKYSKEFQARLRGSKKPVDHATAGAKEIVKLFPNNPFAEILSYCIAGHHTGLPDYGRKSDMAGDGTLLARREKKKLKNYDAYKIEIDVKLLELNPHPLKKSAQFRIGDNVTEYNWFSISFLTRMVFSTLVDADWLETERYMQEAVKPRGQHASISTLTQKFNHFLARFDKPQGEINRKRTETLKHCVAKAEHKLGFFTLTVPTGGGKTFTSMAFALNHAVKHGLKRIIYVIPFTSIIEQNADEFRKSLGDLGQDNVLEHHSNFDWDGKRKNVDDETNKVYEKLKLAAENWDIPIVVTTNVQFFESLFASKKKSARKLHNIAKSVIIFDEAQMLPRDYLKPSLLAVQELVQNYGVSAVFCTATQPSLQRFFPEDTQFTELAPNPQELFNFYRRVQVKNLEIQTDEDLILKLNAHTQALCIVNTRKHAKGLYDRLDRDGSFHLSTLMCPAHRKKTLKEIKQRLINKQPCRVVSTQVMEAGIDVDFPVGYRALAGLDSIIQAAGRVNREGEQVSGDMFVFTPKTEFIKRTPTFIEQTAAVAESALRNFEDDPTSIKAIEAYYEMLYALQPEQNFDTRKILSYFNNGTKFDFRTAAESFKLIDNNTVSIIILYDNKAKRLIETLKYTDYPNKTLRKLQTYTVNIYEREFMNLQNTGVIKTIGDQYHFLDERWMGDYYHPETGLELHANSGGQALFYE